MPVPKINVDLQQERDNVKFDLKELTNWFYGGAKNVEERKSFGKFGVFVTEKHKAVNAVCLFRKCLSQ